MNKQDSARVEWINSEIYEMKRKEAGFEKRRIALLAERNFLLRNQELVAWDENEAKRKQSNYI